MVTEVALAGRPACELVRVCARSVHQIGDVTPLSVTSAHAAFADYCVLRFLAIASVYAASISSAIVSQE